MSKLDYVVQARHIGGRSVATARAITLAFDCIEDGKHDAFEPMELLLASVSACLVQGTVRAARLNRINIDAIEVRIHGRCQEAPPKVVEIDYEVLVKTTADEQKLELVQKSLAESGAITNTVAAAIPVTGRVRSVRELTHTIAG